MRLLVIILMLSPASVLASNFEVARPIVWQETDYYAEEKSTEVVAILSLKTPCQAIPRGEGSIAIQTYSRLRQNCQLIYDHQLVPKLNDLLVYGGAGVNVTEEWAATAKKLESELKVNRLQAAIDTRELPSVTRMLNDKDWEEQCLSLYDDILITTPESFRARQIACALKIFNAKHKRLQTKPKTMEKRFVPVLLGFGLAILGVSQIVVAVTQSYQIDTLKDIVSIQAEKLKNFGDSFNVTEALVRNMQREQKSVADLALLTKNEVDELKLIVPDAINAATNVQTSLQEAINDAEDLIVAAKEGHLDVRAFSRLWGNNELNSYHNHDTTLELAQWVTNTTIALKFHVRARSKNVHIGRVVYVGDERFGNYSGPSYFIFNATNNCLRGISAPTSRFVLETCSYPDHDDPELKRVVYKVPSEEELVAKKFPTVYLTNFNAYVSCYGYSIQIESEIVSCPNRPLKIPIKTSWSTVGLRHNAKGWKLATKMQDRLPLELMQARHPLPSTGYSVAKADLRDLYQTNDALVTQLRELREQREKTIFVATLPGSNIPIWLIIFVLIIIAVVLFLVCRVKY